MPQALIRSMQKGGSQAEGDAALREAVLRVASEVMHPF